jgi:hypothetical protein
LDFRLAGHPFKPVTYPFVAYFFSRQVRDYEVGIDLQSIVKKRKTVPIETINDYQRFDDVARYFEIENSMVGVVNPKSTAFTYVQNSDELRHFRRIAGDCEYIGREGIEFYPQEVFILRPQYSIPAPEGHIYCKNFQTQRSKYRVSESLILLETKFLHPLVKGVDITESGVERREDFLVPFPYSSDDYRLPIPMEILRDLSPHLSSYLLRHQDVLESQTGYNARIIGKANQAFYALARVGEYSFRDIHVAYRDNSKWVASVVAPLTMQWGERVRPLFQNHAPTICERTDGSWIDLEEASYVSGILNCEIVRRYILASSDSRTFKIRPPVRIPLYDPRNNDMKRLSNIATSITSDDEQRTEKMREIEELYLSICSDEN